MRAYFIPLFCCVLLLTVPVAAQNTAVQNTATPAAPPQEFRAKDLQALGQPLVDDSKRMVDRYVYFNEDITDKNIGLSRPVLSHADIAEWIESHLPETMNFSGTSYDRQIKLKSMLFSPRGYADYVMYLNQANMGTFLKDNNLKIASYVDGTPNITASGLRDVRDNVTAEDGTPAPTKNIYVWQAEATLVLSYLDYQNQPPLLLFPKRNQGLVDNRFPVKVRLELIRIPLQKNGNLISINRIRFSTQ